MNYIFTVYIQQTNIDILISIITREISQFNIC